MENLYNGKCYVGQTHRLQDREQAHRAGKCNCPALKNAINKYGQENFDFSIIEKCFSQEELDEREQYWIKVIPTQIPHGYNIKEGGSGGGPCDDNTRQKISIANRGKKRTPEQIENIRQAQVGKKLSDEHKAKLRDINLGKKMSKEAIEKTRQFWLGRKHSEESKRKMSESSKGFKHSEESKKKIKETLLGRTFSPESRRKMSIAAKKREQRRREAL